MLHAKILNKDLTQSAVQCICWGGFSATKTLNFSLMSKNTLLFCSTFVFA